MFVNTSARQMVRDLGRAVVGVMDHGGVASTKEWARRLSPLTRPWVVSDIFSDRLDLRRFIHQILPIATDANASGLIVRITKPELLWEAKEHPVCVGLVPGKQRYWPPALLVDQRVWLVGGPPRLQWLTFCELVVREVPVEGVVLPDVTGMGLARKLDPDSLTYVPGLPKAAREWQATQNMQTMVTHWLSVRRRWGRTPGTV